MQVRADRQADVPALQELGLAPAPGLWVLEKEGRVIGAAALWQGQLAACTVLPAWRRRGYGTFLLRSALRMGVPPGDGVYARVPEENRAAQALLRRCGFAPAAAPPGADAGTPGPGAAALTYWQRGVRAPENALSIVHAFLRAHVKPGAFALDATAGNGHDTLFLCRLVGRTGRVVALDIQPAAVEATNARLRRAGFAGVGRAVLDSHAALAAYVPPAGMDAAVFNLGYLPGGDHTLFTQPHVSVPAMRTALGLLRPGGVMTACLYYGGAQGTGERDEALALFNGLPAAGWRVAVHQPGGAGCPPIPICVERLC